MFEKGISIPPLFFSYLREKKALIESTLNDDSMFPHLYFINALYLY